MNNLQKSELIKRLLENPVERSYSPNLQIGNFISRSTLHPIKKFPRKLDNRFKRLKTGTTPKANNMNFKREVNQDPQKEKHMNNGKKHTTKSKSHTNTNDWIKYNWDIEHTRINTRGENEIYGKSTKLGKF